MITPIYPQWIANIVPVPKKDGKVKMCVDYRDLNIANPKDGKVKMCVDEHRHVGR